MKIPRVLLAAALLFLCATISFAEHGYWITFSESFGFNRKFLMKIDQDGNVLMNPVQLVDFTKVGKVNGATAVWDQGDSIIFWTPVLAIKSDLSGRGPDISLPFRIGRGLYNLTSNTVTSFVVTNLETADPDFLQAGRLNGGFAFLAYEKGGLPFRQPQSPLNENNGSLRAAEVRSNGLPTNNRWRLSPRTDGGNDQGGVAADGRMAISNDHDSPPDKLYAQVLNSWSIPGRDPKVVTNYEGTFTNIDSVDVTNELPNGRRYVLYQASLAPVNPFAAPPSFPTIELQKVSSTTGAKLGRPIRISEDYRFDWRQVIAVDPDGHFVVFTSAGNLCPIVPGASPSLCIAGSGRAGMPSFSCEDLLYQALDLGGNPSGDPIVLLDSCDLDAAGFMGLDIAKD